MSKVKIHKWAHELERFTPVYLAQDYYDLQAEVEGLKTSHESMLKHFTAMRKAAGGHNDTMQEAVARVETMRQQLHHATERVRELEVKLSPSDAGLLTPPQEAGR